MLYPTELTDFWENVLKTRILIYLDTSGNDVPINSDIHHKGISCCQVAFIMNVLLGMRTWSK